MKGQGELIYWGIIAVIVVGILSAFIQSQACDKCYTDLNATQAERDILKINNQMLGQQLSTCEKERDDCKINLSNCEANLAQSRNETAVCIQDVQRLETKNTYIFITIFLSAIMSIVTILKQFQRLPEYWRKKDWWWIAISVLILVFAVLGLRT